MDLLILGASARAAAFSAMRIGLQPICADLFADADLAAHCPAHRVAPGDYPDGLATFAETLPSTPWLYTGALENRPDLVDRISQRHPLLGNPGAVLRRVRDPILLARLALEAGLEPPKVALDPLDIPRDGSWLVKPLDSAGGKGIREYRGVPRRDCYYQKRVEGTPMSAIFVADRTAARLLGLTRQFIGSPRSTFAYIGTIAPWDWPISVERVGTLERLGTRLTATCGLRGLFGVDFLNTGASLTPVEVNPRYTAAIEALEWALGRSLLAEHLAVFGLGASSAHPPPAANYIAKQILFAGKAGTVRLLPFESDPSAFPEIADVPAPGTHYQPGEPLLTVFGRGEYRRAAVDDLAEKINHWNRLTWPG
jgi:predicted ATP-grasp superfamily ATP-dependent carboligase